MCPWILSSLWRQYIVLENDMPVLLYTESYVGSYADMKASMCLAHVRGCTVKWTLVIWIGCICGMSWRMYHVWFYSSTKGCFSPMMVVVCCKVL